MAVRYTVAQSKRYKQTDRKKGTYGSKCLLKKLRSETVMPFIQQVSLLCMITDRQAGPQQNSKEQIDMHINTKTLDCSS